MSTESVIYIDECGFTGEDLVDEEQPVMVVASHGLSMADAAALKNLYFGKVQAPELKHVGLQRRAANQAAVIHFLKSVIESDSVRLAVAHKQYCLVLKMIDWLVEPAMHRSGIDLYRRGAHQGLGNVIYGSLNAHGGTLFARTVRTFQTALRTRQRRDIRECFQLLCSSQFDQLFVGLGNPFARGIAELGEDWVIDLPPGSLDISLPLAMQNCLAWKERGWSDVTVYHDRSSAMARNKPVWDALLSKDAPRAQVGWGTRVVEYPIGVARTEFVDSALFVGVQLADIIAGAFARWSRWLLKGKPTSDAYSVALYGVFLPHLDRFVANAIWPSDKIEAWAEPEAGVQDPNDYAASVLLDKNLTMV